MLSTRIKEATKTAHQELEGKVVKKLKAIRSNADYADLLKHFYAYFSGLEKQIASYITTNVLPDHELRRNASRLKEDILALDGDTYDLPQVTLPLISNTSEALGAMYVMEGSIMGGPFIVQMLQKGGIDKGLSFFSGYGEDTQRMWAKFIEVLNLIPEEEQAIAIDAANDTFSNFSDVFELKLA